MPVNRVRFGKLQVDRLQAWYSKVTIDRPQVLTSPEHPCRLIHLRFPACNTTHIPASALGKDGHVAPSNRITVAQIGLGRMGGGHTRFLAHEPSVEMLAVCDVDQTRREATLATVKTVYKDRKVSCKAYNDYREVLARDDIDAVVIVTPDHWHTSISIDAAKAGKDIYCEKPVSLTVREGRELVQTVRRNKRIFQTGTQYRSIPTIRQVCNFVRECQIGSVVNCQFIQSSRPFASPFPLSSVLAANCAHRSRLAHIQPIA